MKLRYRVQQSSQLSQLFEDGTHRTNCSGFYQKFVTLLKEMQECVAANKYILEMWRERG